VTRQTNPLPNDTEPIRRWLNGLFIGLPVVGFLILALLFIWQTVTGADSAAIVPVNLHSVLLADYSVDPNPTRLPSVRLNIIWDTIQDREPGATNLDERQATVLDSLLTPVPTVTPSLSSCEGVHFIYASQDTWVDSAAPGMTHGTGTNLQLGRNGENIKQLLLYFPIFESLPPNTLIHSARLEMDVSQVNGTLPAGALAFFGLSAPFGELDADWTAQPQFNAEYQTPELAFGSIHLWDVTEIVRDWMIGRYKNNGLVIAPQAGGDFEVVYYSREIVTEAIQSPDNAQGIPVGPRLVINCGGTLPQAVAMAIHTPTPTAKPEKPSSSPEDPDPESATSPTPVLLEATIPVVPSATFSPASPPNETPTTAPPQTPLPTLTPNPTLPPVPGSPTPSPPPPPPPSPSPPPPDGGDGDGGGGGDPPLPKADLGLSKSASVDPVVAGTRLTYTLKVMNNGPDTVTNVRLIDTIPQGVDLVSVTPSQGPGCTGTESVSCNLGRLVPGKAGSVSLIVDVNPDMSRVLSNAATVTADQTDPIPANNSARTVTRVISETDLVIDKDDMFDPVVAGENLTYTIKVFNGGPSNATGVIITDVLPATTSFLTASSGCNHLGGVVTCSVGNLAVGTSQPFTLAVNTDASIGNGAIITNTGFVTGQQFDPDLTNNLVTEPTSINEVADLAITKTDTPDPVVAGETLSYSLAISNNGPSDAGGITITDTLPTGVSFASASPGCSQSAGVVTCTLAGLSSGANLARTIVVTVNSATTGLLSNSVEISGNQFDPDSSNNSDLITTTVNAVADLQVSKTDTPDPVVAGETLSYSLAISNNGPSDAGGITITDTLPTGVSFASASPGCSESAGVVTCTLAGLSSGANLARTIVVTVNSATTGLLSNSVEIQRQSVRPGQQ
jgi:uncharacterized repeat protein (TIGR01451 family)